jgi:molybdopterin synthase sulfur carrier subunit
MKVNFFATLRPIVGGKTVEFELPERATAADLLNIVVERFPPLRAELLDEQGQLYPHVHLFVNGRDAPYLPDGMETVLKPTDTVNIFPAVAGG